MNIQSHQGPDLDWAALAGRLPRLGRLGLPPKNRGELELGVSPEEKIQAGALDEAVEPAAAAQGQRGRPGRSRSQAGSFHDMDWTGEKPKARAQVGRSSTSPRSRRTPRP